MDSPSWVPSPAYAPPEHIRPSGRFSDTVRHSRFDDAPQHSGGDGHDSRQRHHLPPDRHPPGSTMSLEGRLGERYEGRYADGEVYRSQGPPGPSFRRDQDRFVDDGRRHIIHTESRGDERRGKNWDYEDRRQFDGQDRTQIFEDQPVAGQEGPTSRATKPPRTRRVQRPSDHIDVEMTPAHSRRNSGRDIDQKLPPYATDEPHVSRPGGSLLDRLSFDTRGAPESSDVPPSSSLRDRVQIPSKRDRQEMMGMPSGDFQDVDEMGVGDSGRKMRRRSGKPKGRRGRSG
jgi:hypothetical protein